MIKEFGIGIDIVDVNNFKKISYSSKPNFYKKIFLQSEIEYCLKSKNKYERFAGKFAVKEAVKKAITESVSMLEIETIHVNSKPSVILKNKLKDRYQFLVSISHEKKIAVAVVIAQSNRL